jgi:hypothetical protein
MEYWSVGVLRQVRIAAALRVEDTGGAGDKRSARNLGTEFFGVACPATNHFSPLTPLRHDDSQLPGLPQIGALGKHPAQ